MTIGKQNVTFSWGNYSKPTPKNLERFVTFVRDTLAGLAALSAFSDHPTAAMWLSVSIIVTGQLSKFFASVAHDVEEEKEEAQAGS